MSKMMNRIRQMCHQYKALAVMGLYAVVYLVAFYYLEIEKLPIILFILELMLIYRFVSILSYRI